MDVLTSMKQRLADAEADAERLRAAISIFEANGTPSADSVVPASRYAERARPAPRDDVVPLGRLLRTVTENPGTTTTTLTKLTGGHQASILQLLKEAEADGTVRREGERRATSWFAVSR